MLFFFLGEHCAPSRPRDREVSAPTPRLGARHLCDALAQQNGSHPLGGSRNPLDGCE